MTILGSTKLGSSVTGHQELVALATEQAELDAEIEPAIEDEIVERFIQCSNHALPYFSVKFHIFNPKTFKIIEFVPLVSSGVDKIRSIHDRKVSAH